MRFVVLDPLEAQRATRLAIEVYFDLWKIEIERAASKAALAQPSGQLPGEMQALSKLIVRRGAQNRVRLLIGQPARALNHCPGKARLPGCAIPGQANEDR